MRRARLAEDAARARRCRRPAPGSAGRRSPRRRRCTLGRSPTITFVQRSAAVLNAFFCAVVEPAEEPHLDLVGRRNRGRGLPPPRGSRARTWRCRSRSRQSFSWPSGSSSSALNAGGGQSARTSWTHQPPQNQRGGDRLAHVPRRVLRGVDDQAQHGGRQLAPAHSRSSNTRSGAVARSCARLWSMTASPPMTSVDSGIGGSPGASSPAETQLRADSASPRA